MTDFSGAAVFWLDQVNAMLGSVADGLASFRARLVDGGVPEEVADEMTAGLGGMWMARLFGYSEPVE